MHVPKVCTTCGIHTSPDPAPPLTASHSAPFCAHVLKAIRSGVLLLSHVSKKHTTMACRYSRYSSSILLGRVLKFPMMMEGTVDLYLCFFSQNVAPVLPRCFLLPISAVMNGLSSGSVCASLS
ncbi:hypothetical protein XENOCAPTIV_007524, partial [Xenoophorus captivus]